jgi:glycosyltransferase involved in cell wall biosynthesis
MELAQRGGVHRVVVFRREGFFLDPVEQVCGPVEEIGIQGLLKWQTYQAVRRLARRLREEEFDLLHTWDADAAIFGQFAARWAGIPLITSRRDLGQIYPTYKMKLMRRADLQARCIVANAQAIVETMVRQNIPRECFRVIPNIIDVSEFDRQFAEPFARQEELPEGTRLMMVARLDPEKDVATFINAAVLIGKAHPAASFVIAGDGVERTMLTAMAMRCGLGDRIVFLGDVREVPALLRLGAIGVLTPSRNEGLSNTILEYMAASLPVVATDCGGNRELILPEGGSIVPSGDSQALADAVLELLRKPARRKSCGEFNRKQVVERHQPKAVGEQFAELYREIAYNKGQGQWR